MLDVNKQADWQDPLTGRVKEDVSLACLRDPQFEQEWEEWCVKQDEEHFVAFRTSDLPF